MTKCECRDKVDPSNDLFGIKKPKRFRAASLLWHKTQTIKALGLKSGLLG